MVSVAVGTFEVIVRAFRALFAFLALMSRMLCRSVLSAGALYAPWFTVISSCWVCEFVAVEALVYPLRFGIGPDIAVVAPEEYARLAVDCVRLVAGGDHYWSVVDTVQGSSCD